jgi:hypothetical protein
MNELIPCASLSSELLGRIFEFLNILEELSKCDNGWLSITCVCKKRRAAALGHAALWSTLSTASKQPWDVFLQLSRTSPLSISAIVPNSAPEYLQHIAQHFYRICTLSFETESHDLSIMTLISDVTTASGLQVLKLSRATNPRLVRSHLSLILPGKSFSEVAPNIRELKLHNFQFPWTATTPNIVSLTVAATWAVPAPSVTSMQMPWFGLFTVHDVLQSLSRMSNLRTLSLNHLPDSLPLFRTAARRLTDLNSIILLYLTELHLGGKLSQCVRFFRPAKHIPWGTSIHTDQSFHESGFEVLFRP